MSKRGSKSNNRTSGIFVFRRRRKKEWKGTYFSNVVILLADNNKPNLFMR
jgi:hypothetical protein